MKKLPAIHSLVVTHHGLDAAIWRVVETDGAFRVGLIDRELEGKVENQAVQWTDKSLLLTPSIGQLKFVEIC